MTALPSPFRPSAPIRLTALATARLTVLAAGMLLLSAGARGAQPAPVQGEASGAQDQVPPIQAVGDSYILQFASADDGAEPMTLERFVRTCQEATGKNFTYSEETATQLKNAKIRLYGQKRVKREDFYNFFQIMMIINDFVCKKVGPDHLEVIVLQNLQSSRGQGLRDDALFVPPDRLEEFADQPATLITTIVTLPNIDVRTLSNALRGMISDANTQQILPVGNSQSMILTGFGSYVAALARMLSLVDEVSATGDVPTPDFEVIPLEFASAEEISDTVEELLEARTQQVDVQQQQRNEAQGVSGAIRRNTGGAKIMVDPRTNSLLVMALPDVMPQIKELVARLDIDVVERERNYHIYSPDNVDAEEPATVLEDFLRDASRLQPTNVPGQQAQQNRQANEVAVVPDPATNSILIAANRTRYEEVLDLIRRLDQRQDQVLIETALVELTGSEVLDLGVEWGLADIPGTGQNGGFGVTNFGLSSFEDTDNDGIPDTRVPGLGQGITAGFLDGDDFSLPLLISALKTRRNTNVLNIPSVLVNNNGSATIRSLDEQPTTQITANGVGGQTQENFQGFQEAGITLKISPTISASRYLRLNVDLEVSSFLGAFSGAIPAPRITRQITTVINVPDGDTMVIGGIVIDNKNKTRNSLPWLGDIPLIGALFRRDTDNQDRTTLYFFVTPHIMRDTAFADLAEFSYKKKLEAASTIGTSRLRIMDPSFGVQNEGLDLRGFDVPLYQSPQRGEIDGNDVGIDSRRVNEMLEGENR